MRNQSMVYNRFVSVDDRLLRQSQRVGIKVWFCPRSRYADYVQWYRQWQAQLDSQQFFDNVFTPPPPPDQTVEP